MPRAFVFDAYGTLFDVHSVQARCEALWPGKGAQLSQLWRAKQLEYTWQRSLMRRYAPFSQVTVDALLFSCEFLGLKIEKKEKQTLMDEYRRLALYPDVVTAMKKLKSKKCAILTNGSPDMIEPLGAKSFGFAVYWINRAQAPVDRTGFQPDRIVKSLDEILP